MFIILSTYTCWKKIYKMQHLEGSRTPVLYIGRAYRYPPEVAFYIYYFQQI